MRDAAAGAVPCYSKPSFPDLLDDGACAVHESSVKLRLCGFLVLCPANAPFANATFIADDSASVSPKTVKFVFGK